MINTLICFSWKSLKWTRTRFKVRSHCSRRRRRNSWFQQTWRICHKTRYIMGYIRFRTPPLPPTRWKKHQEIWLVMGVIINIKTMCLNLSELWFDSEGQLLRVMVCWHFRVGPVSKFHKFLSLVPQNIQIKICFSDWWDCCRYGRRTTGILLDYI